jgi:transcriptional regulator with PAS, ATPase and Fis domain
MLTLAPQKVSTLKRLMRVILQEIPGEQAGLIIDGEGHKVFFCEPLKCPQPELISFLEKSFFEVMRNNKPQVMIKDLSKEKRGSTHHQVQLLLVPFSGFSQKGGVIFTWRYWSVYSAYEIEFLLKFSTVFSWLIEGQLERKRCSEHTEFFGLIGQSRQFRRLVEFIKKISSSDAPVMICGESGTGKELVARAIHLSSRRAQKKFVPLNCAAIPEFLLESELFGFTRGAFTGAAQNKPGLIELADEGTFFLDEITDLSPSLQAKILRLIQEGELRRLGETKVRRINTRFISATNRDIEVEVEKGNFRRDLLYRLKVITIEVPPLRERREDIPLLLDYFLNKYREDQNQRCPFFSPRAVEILVGYEWPGNIRELENEVRRCLALFPERELFTEDCLSPKFFPEREIKNRGGAPFDYFQAKAEFERRFLQQALTRFNFNKSKTAAEIGLSRQGLFKLLKKHKITLPQGAQSLGKN